jgi:hypothetical protein
MSPLSPSLFLRSIRLLAMTGVLALLACTGCIPNVSWLPDSSGFVHSGSDGRQIVHYDLASRKQRVVVENTGTRTTWPTVSPDGKRVAVARHLLNRDYANTMEVILYDFQGKEVQHSTTFQWSEPNGSTNGNMSEVFLYWSPKSEHILVLAGENTGIYDVRNDGLIILDKAFPFAVSSTPVRPEGDGFLVARPVGDQALQYTFVNWEGREYSIAMAPVEAIEGREWVQFPLLYNSRWEGNTAVVKHSTNRLRLDTNRYKGELRTNVPREAEEGEVHQQLVFENGAVLRVLRVKERGGADDPNDCTHVRIEWLERPGAKPRAVVERAEACLVFPAPNRRLVALRCDPVGKGNSILVINEKGEIAVEMTP